MGHLEDAAATLIDFRPAIQRLCGRLVPCRARAEELTQETLLVGFTRLGALRDLQLLRRWLLVVARYLCANERRKRRALLTVDGFVEAEDPVESALERLVRAERDRWVRTRVEVVLDAVQRKAVELRYFEDQPIEVVSRHLGVAHASGARGVLQTCRRRLRSDLDAQRADFD
ncbi:MAG: sigma-70 family RNA polymerase sigma factor [Myxococcota bacterium]